MEYEDVVEFITDWLDCWTGNRPDDLITFYSEDALYKDPAKPEGLRGRKEIFPYFQKLLKSNPNWIWSAREIYPTDNGVVLKWHCEIPVGDETIEEDGMDIVDISDMKIIRNEVYFDRSRLLEVIQKLSR